MARTQRSIMVCNRTRPSGLNATQLSLLITGMLLGALGLPASAQVHGGSSPAATSEIPTSTPSDAVIQLGIEGFVKRGKWAHVRTSGGSFNGQSIAGYDGEGFPCRTQVRSDDTGYVKIGRRLRELRLVSPAELQAGPTTIPIQSERIIESLQQLVLIVGGELDITDAIRMRRRSPAEKMVSHVVESVTSLPVDRLGYDAVDVVVLCTADPAWLQNVSELQLTALTDWVRAGGRLIISAGMSADAVFGDGGRLRHLLPGTYVGPNKQRVASGLEAFVKAGSAIKMRDEVGRITGIATFSIDDLRGRVLVEDGVGKDETPWLVQTAYGLGSILLVSTDLDSGPIAEWKDRSRFVTKLLDLTLGVSNEDDTQRTGQVRHLGFTDLTGQLRAALDQFPGVWLVPFSLIAGLLALYVILLGPIDYFALKYLGARMQWTWLTFPLLVVAFGTLAWAMAGRVKSGEAKLNQVDLLDVDLATGQMRNTTWAHLYSPTATAYEVDLTPGDAWETQSADSILGWQGLPGAGFAGLEGQGFITPIEASFENQWSESANGWRATLSQLGLPARSTRSLAGTWISTAEFSADTELSADVDGLLQGQFTNVLPMTLRHCAIAFDQWFYKLGTIRSAETVSMEQAGRPLNLSYRLMRRQVNQRGDRDFNDRATPWDRTSFDIGRIMEMMMFHEAAGGRSYTGLLNRFHGELDLSDHLQMGVAIVFGRMTEPASELQVRKQGGEASLEVTAESTPFCRILVPVQRTGR